MIDKLTKTVNTMAVSNMQLTTALANKEAECNALVNDNKTLSTKVLSLTTKLSKRSWEFYTAKPTLLIATLGDVDGLHDALSTDDKRYKKIFVCAGTNECRKSEMDIEVVNENVSTLLKVIQAKVAAPNDIVVSSTPPRADSTRAQQRVEELIPTTGDWDYPWRKVHIERHLVSFS